MYPKRSLRCLDNSKHSISNGLTPSVSIVQCICLKKVQSYKIVVKYLAFNDKKLTVKESTFNINYLITMFLRRA